MLRFGGTDMNSSIPQGKYELLCEVPLNLVVFSIYYKEN